MRTPLLAGNWKMHTTPSEGLRLLSELIEALDGREHDHVELAVNVPATHVASLAARARGGPVGLGAQDLSAHDEGPYTGEVSGAMLRDAGASSVIVGHSERRAHHHEDDAQVGAKVRAALRHGLVPILCVGETEDEREAGHAERVVLRQLRTALDGVELEDPEDLIVAYEPVWAIGTGRTATADDAHAMCATVRAALGELFPDRSDAMRVLYGGSMKPGNAAELLARSDVDGGLIGGASLRVEDFLGIMAATR